MTNCRNTLEIREKATSAKWEGIINHILHMLRLTEKKVIPNSDYTLMIEFDNGEKKWFDVAPYIRGEWYGHLSDQAYFMTAQPDGFTVAWPKGQDLCPDELYCLSVPIEEVLGEAERD